MMQNSIQDNAELPYMKDVAQMTTSFADEK
jgi:hypothetical protein